MKSNLDKLLKETADLIKIDKHEQAFSLLNAELRNPLYSLQEQDIIRDRIAALAKFIKQISIDTRWDKADKNELIKIFVSEGYEMPILDILFERFGKDLKTSDFLKLQQVFLDDSVTNEMKVTYLNIFKDYEIKHTFDFHNTLIDKTFKVNTAKDFSLNTSELLYKVNDQLAALYFKETSKETLARQIVNAIYYYYFGDFKKIKYDYDTLFNSIVDYIDHAFDNITPVDKEFAAWINKMLEQ